MKKTLLVVLLSVTLVALYVGISDARSGYLSDMNGLYGTAGTRLDTCDACHVPGGKSRNPYGLDVEAGILSGKTATQAMVAVEAADSDGDTFSNLTEIQALTFPGDPNDKPGAPACTDADGDGYAVEGGDCGAIDCNDNNAAVNPGAIEICNNNIDDNCNGKVDCADAACGTDPACAGICIPTASTERNKCTDAKDNDCDGALDCADSDCSKNRACK